MHDGYRFKITSLEFRQCYLEEQKARQKEKHEIASKTTGSLYNYIFKINVK